MPEHRFHKFAGSKREKILMLLQQGDANGRELRTGEIARIVGSHINEVCLMKRRWNAERMGVTQVQRIERLEQDVRDLRALVMYKLDAARYGVAQAKAKPKLVKSA